MAVPRRLASCLLVAAALVLPRAAAAQSSGVDAAQSGDDAAQSSGVDVDADAHEEDAAGAEPELTGGPNHGCATSAHDLAAPASAATTAGVEVVDAPLPPPFDPLAGLTITSSPNRAADLVVVVSIDGLRADAVLPSHRTFAMLRRAGVRADNAFTIRRSTTLASHAAMLSGVDADVHGLTWNAWRPQRGRIRFPTVLRVAARAGLPAAMFVGKNKLRHLVGEEDSGIAFTVNGRSCGAVAERATPWLRDTASGVAMLHFADPDGAGHRRGWMSPTYLAAVTAADRCLATVVSALRARTHGTERVLLIVTADHGGHGRSHGSALDVDRHIPWFAWGGAATRALRIEREVTTMDTAATVLAALGLPQTAGMAGRPLTEALRPREAVVASVGARDAARASVAEGSARRPAVRSGGTPGRLARAPARSDQ